MTPTHWITLGIGVLIFLGSAGYKRIFCPPCVAIVCVGISVFLLSYVLVVSGLYVPTAPTRPAIAQVVPGLPAPVVVASIEPVKVSVSNVAQPKKKPKTSSAKRKACRGTFMLPDGEVVCANL